MSPNPLARLVELSASHPDLTPFLTREMALRARRYMNGVKLYREYPARRSDEERNAVWSAGTTRILDYAPENLRSPIILIVPSLINRYTILDLHPSHSLVEMLASHSFRPLVVDWGTPGEQEKTFTTSDYILQRLIPALRVISATAPVHILGYCMGGLLALALAQLCSELTRTLSLLATPWDFHAGYRATGQNGWACEEKLKAWLEQDDPLPIDVVQGLFTSFQPLHAFRKFSTFAGCDQKSFGALRFVLTEDWLNEGVQLSAPSARDCFGEWCTRNVTAEGKWYVGRDLITPHLLTMPTYALVPGRDRIVPPESAMPLARAIPHAVRHEPMMGHIGILASPAAPHQAWKPLIAWIESH